MIAKREKWLAEKASRQHHSIERLVEPVDPENANEAMILLGIAERDTRDYGPNDEYERLLLLPWAVQAALSRPGRRRLSAHLIKRAHAMSRSVSGSVGCCEPRRTRRGGTQFSTDCLDSVLPHTSIINSEHRAEL